MAWSVLKTCKKLHHCNGITTNAKIVLKKCRLLRISTKKLYQQLLFFCLSSSEKNHHDNSNLWLRSSLIYGNNSMTKCSGLFQWLKCITLAHKKRKTAFSVYPKSFNVSWTAMVSRTRWCHQIILWLYIFPVFICWRVEN